jgi:hypothetical protein
MRTVSAEEAELTGSRCVLRASGTTDINAQDNIEAWVNVAGSLLGMCFSLKHFQLIRRRLKGHDRFPVGRDERYSGAGERPGVIVRASADSSILRAHGFLRR